MPNSLAREKSPYLLQHAANPVDWLAWGETAFAKSRAENKPIFLSIGYSTCHWCHVMAHESFENPAIAALLNEHFVPVKVDREERPDVDRVYMTYVQAMTGHGGWPLSAWLTPDLKPFYGGTYYPPEDRNGRPGFGSILQVIARGWSDDRTKLVAEANRVIDNLREHYAGRGPAGSGDGGTPGSESLVDAGSAAFERGFQYFYEAFDSANGGFGGAPKFPRAANLEFLLRVAALQGVESELGREAVGMTVGTLQAMARGGIHDHVGGGFHRYSVDERWFVPHFEKMLYDQAQIAANLLAARQATGDERFAWTARDVLAYAVRELRTPAGGFHTAEDADSATSDGGHAEGAFYVWTHAEIASAVGADAPLFSAHYGITEGGNVPPELDPQGEFRGRNILAQTRPLAETAQAFNLPVQEANDRLMAALDRLRSARARRPRPHRDDKILTATNGLMISALARAHQVLGADDPTGIRWLETANGAASFIQRELYDGFQGVLFRAWREGRSDIRGFAEDYALLIQGLLDLYEAGFDLRWLRWAGQLQSKMDELFWDEAAGGYFNSAADDSSIVLRLKEDHDGAEPAPSSVAAMNLLRLSALLNSDGLRDRARRTLAAFQPQWSRSPQALPQMLCALELALEPPRHAVIAGDPDTDDFRALIGVLHERIGPRRSLLALDGGAGQAWLAAHAPWLAEMKPTDGRATVYLCEEYACHAPTSDPATLRELLRK
ncbi:MAG TPA: thioredoxin domain-containing protein [Opitutaceae bacterium]|nr:thioredoxin domain-containing protein [Opitutaceae bacterium]